MGITIDLAICMGQSNMAGRGVVTEAFPEPAPLVIDGAGYEFKAITDPTCLYPLTNSFGVAENRIGYIDDRTAKTGSMIPSFANAYYMANGKIATVYVSASEGGTYIHEWETSKITDAKKRLADCVFFLAANEFKIRHIFMLWCQGETDASHGTPKDEYLSSLGKVIGEMIRSGCDKCFMIRIGNYNSPDAYDKYKPMISWQTRYAETNENVIMVSYEFAGMRERGLMKDAFHYYQQGYNEVGKSAGENVAAFYKSEKRTPVCGKDEKVPQNIRAFSHPV